MQHGESAGEHALHETKKYLRYESPREMRKKHLSRTRVGKQSGMAGEQLSHCHPTKARYLREEYRQDDSSHARIHRIVSSSSSSRDVEKETT